MDFRKLAQRRLPSPIFHYMDGGADDEWTLRNNTAAFEHYEFSPSVLNSVADIGLRTRILGADSSMPVFLAPTGMTRLFHHGRELAVARAAARAGVMYTLSTVATSSIEDVRKAGDGPKMFQVYVFKDRGLSRELMQRCKDAGYTALCLTVDSPLAGNRERDKRTGMTMPPRFGLASLASFAMSPHWTFNYLRDSNFSLPNIAQRVEATGATSMSLFEYVNGQLDRSLTWADCEWLIREWDGPFAIKGVMSAPDAQRAQAIGATAVMISNHGGRQLDGAPAPVDCVSRMRDAVGDSLELIVDGGVRRGTHVMKALAAGADAVSLGRPYLYGLAAGGERGVDRVLMLMRQEIERSMALLGKASIHDLVRSDLRRVGDVSDLWRSVAPMR